ncbi:MAG: hypothetical protein D6814_12680 [Calditrichaeota bacterium]|nr:MAG: hypothetical protein D6814_12680 [Calditrichota bacterium]
MKRIAVLLGVAALALASALAAAQTLSTEQLKKDLVGHYMGAREKGWKFTSTEQIQSLKIQSQKEASGKRIYTIQLHLKARNLPAVYEAVALVTYEKANNAWKLKVIGLKSFKKLQ